MNWLFKILGVVWILLSLLIGYYVLSTATREIIAGEPADASIFWPVIITIFLPILVGFGLFGYYSIKGEYDE